MQLEIDEIVLTGFNEPAKNELKKVTLQFTEDLLRESNRIEASRNSVSGNPQVTSSMVVDAAVLIRRGLVQPKKNLRIKSIRILAAVLSMAVGIIYDATKLQDKTYMLIFVIVVALAIVAVTISTILE